MNIKINDILIVGTDTKYIKAIATINGVVPVFSYKAWITIYTWDTLSIVTNSYMFDLETKLDEYIYEPWYFPQKNATYALFPCWLSYYQEYCIPSIELIEEVQDSSTNGIYTCSDTLLDRSIDEDRKSYLIGTIVDGIPALLPPIGPYLRNYHTNDTIQYDLVSDMKHLQVWVLLIPIWEKNVKTGKKYKYSCKFFQDKWFHPELTWCLEVDWLITSVDFNISLWKSYDSLLENGQVQQDI
jgi:hypothetical protein